MSPRLFFDLTLSRRLVGQPPVGIVRTEVRLAGHFLESGPGSCRFCAFDGDSGEFHALEPAEASAIIHPIAPPPPATEPSTGPHPGGLRRWIGRSCRRAVGPWLARRAPELCRAIAVLVDSGRALLQAVASLCRAVVHSAGRPAAPRPAGRAGRPRRLEFRPGDTLVVVGMAWQNGYWRHLQAEKRERGLRVVALCHDLIPVDYPHLVAPSQVAFFRQGYADLVACADKILCNSAYTRERLLQFLAGFDRKPETAVIELGSDPFPAAPMERPAGLPDVTPGRFALFVSTVEIRKNHRLLYQLWNRLAETEPAVLVPLVCVGGPGWRTDDFMRVVAANRRLDGRLFLLQGIDDAALAWLYRNCSFTLYPSLVEGWGLPVAESLSQGKYCVASSASSVIELSRGLLDLLDPLDFAAWHREVRRLLTEPGYLDAKERRLAGYRRRDWAAAGRQFAAEVAAAP
jgi:glycosyltransferase involved in cell wall biosynthesis